ncbi:MAG: glycosyltransferase family 4 protein [Candidatus Fimimorpha sp.]
MKALFCYDGPLYKDENGDYYDSILNDQMFQRYFKVADSLELLIRTREIRKSQAEKKMSKLMNPSINVTECPNLSSISGLIRNYRLAKKIIEERIKVADLIFIRVPSVIGNYSVDICEKLGKKYLLEVVGCPWDSYWNYSLKGKLVAPIATQMMKRRVKQAPFVLYVTNNFLQKRYPTCGMNINCSNVELQPATETIIENRITKIENDRQKMIIGTAAGLDVLYKGQQYVIRALGELKKQGYDDIEYQLIGGGTGAYLQKVAEECNVVEQVNIIGQIPHDKVFEWMDSLDIYAQPSRQEGLPRSMIEAMSRGLPCMGARTAGIPELIDDEFIFSNSKTEINEIVNIILRLYRDKDLRKRVAKRNYLEAEGYSRDILVNRRTSFFETYAKSVSDAKH